MSGLNTYDVIIAGAGPAGSTAAFILSRSGLNVLLLDKSTFPRTKLCGGLITHKTVQLLERVFGETGDSLTQKGIIDYESGTYEVRDRKKAIVHRNFDIPFRFIERYVYDAFLLQKAREAGADLIEGDGLAALDVLKSGIITSSGKRYTGKVIIGADGVNSRTRRNFPVDLFGRNDWRENVASAHKIFVSRSALQKQIDHPTLYFDFIDHGYAWIFPGTHKVTAGICGLRSKNAKSILAAFHDFLTAVHIDKSDYGKIFSYVLPYGSFLPAPVFRNILLVGDAAGFADPLLGEGIFFAQRSAELAAQAIVTSIHSDNPDERLRQHYLGLLHDHVYTEFEYAEKIRNAIFTYLKHGEWYPLKILMSMFGDRTIKAVHGIRSYRWLRNRIPPS